MARKKIKKRPGRPVKKTTSRDERKNKLLKSIAQDPSLPLAEHGRRAGYAEAYVNSGEFYKAHGSTRRKELRKYLLARKIDENFIAGLIQNGLNSIRKIRSHSIETVAIQENKPVKIKKIQYEDIPDNSARAAYADLYIKTMGMDTNEDEYEGDIPSELDNLTGDQLLRIKKIMMEKNKK